MLPAGSGKMLHASTSPAETSAGMAPALATKPAWNEMAASTSLKAASLCSSSSWMVIVPAIVRTAPGPTP